MRPLRPLLLATFTDLFADKSKAILECDAIEARQDIAVRLYRGWVQVRRREFSNNAEQDFTHVIDNMEVSEGQEALLGFVYRLRARCYEGQAEWILCLEDLKKALSLYEADADVAADALAELRDQQNRVKRKQAGEFDSDVDVRPESANRHEILDALVAGELEHALKLCEARIDDINVRFCRGLAKDFRGRRSWTNDNKKAAENDFSQAISDYSDVIEDASSHFLSRAYVRRAMLLIALKQFEDALAGLDELADRQLLNAEDKSLRISAGLSRGLANLRLLKYDEAGKAFVAVLALDPSNLRALDGNGKVDLYTQKRSDALKNFKKGLKHSQEKGDEAHFTFRIALTCHLDGKHEQAMRALEKIEPLLGELKEPERRFLREEIDVVREFLPAIPDSKEAFEEQREVFKSTGEAVAVRCKAGLGWIRDLTSLEYQSAA